MPTYLPGERVSLVARTKIPAAVVGNPLKPLAK